MQVSELQELPWLRRPGKGKVQPSPDAAIDMRFVHALILEVGTMLVLLLDCVPISAATTASAQLRGSRARMWFLVCSQAMASTGKEALS